MSNQSSTGKHTYDISLETRPDGSYLARVLGWADCQVIAATTSEALANIKQLLSDKITNTQIIQIEIHTVPSIAHNPWLATSGIFKDDPYFDEMLVHIEQYRKDLDRDNEDGAN